jgi:hypothetical protein
VSKTGQTTGGLGKESGKAGGGHKGSEGAVKNASGIDAQAVAALRKETPSGEM